MVEQAAVNRLVAGSSPARGAILSNANIKTRSNNYLSLVVVASTEGA